MYQYIRVQDDAGVREVVLDRPRSLNALNYDVLDELEHVARDSQDDSRVRVVLLKGSGRAFCAGDDLKGMGTEQTPLPSDASRRAELGYPRLILSLRRLSKPVIAQVHGAALGAGCDLALSCDLVVAASDATFGLVFTRRGMVAGSALLPQLVGYHRACELLFTGRTFDADEAHRLGLVTTVTDPEHLTAEGAGLARQLSAGPTTALGLMKRAINQSQGLSLDGAVDVQRHMMAVSYGTSDYAEGRQAFIDKREPDFRGR